MASHERPVPVYVGLTEEEYEEICASISANLEANFYVLLQPVSEAEPEVLRARRWERLDDLLWGVGLYRSEPIPYDEAKDLEKFDEEMSRADYEVDGYGSGQNLGKGRFGKVSLVGHEDEDPPGTLARKVFSDSDGDPTKAPKEFISEVRILEKLAERGIYEHTVRLIDAFTICGRQFSLIMTPAADQGNLNNMLKAGAAQNFGLEAALKRAVGCLTIALASYHEQGILHRDIHPGNILFHQNKVLYTDFGSSILAGKSNEESNYAAPELISSNPFSEKTDAYALGGILSKILDHFKVEAFTTLTKEYDTYLSSIIERLTQVSATDRITATRAAIDIFKITASDNEEFMCVNCREWMGERMKTGTFRRILELPIKVPDNLSSEE